MFHLWKASSGAFFVLNRIFRGMKKARFQIGNIVGFKGRGLGFGEIVSINLRNKQEPLYHVKLLSGDMLISTHEEHIEQLSPEDSELVESLHSIGNL